MRQSESVQGRLVCRSEERTNLNLYRSLNVWIGENTLGNVYLRLQTFSLLCHSFLTSHSIVASLSLSQIELTVTIYLHIFLLWKLSIFDMENWKKNHKTYFLVPSLFISCYVNIHKNHNQPQCWGKEINRNITRPVKILK